MNFKKIFTVIFALIISAAFSSCAKNESIEKNSDIYYDNLLSTAVSSTLNDDKNKNTNKNEINTTVSNTNASESTTTATAVISDNPSSWSKSEITEYYKSAAVKSNKNAVSDQVITLKDFSINNGQYENVIDFVMPIMSKILANNSTEKEGITGGYQNLTESDIYEAKAYKIGNNTAIEMVMKSQTSGPYDDMFSGSVGHAISVVGDIGVVTKQIKDFGIDIQITEENTKIYYTDPTVKVIIDEKGNIVCGTWKYTVEISMNNYKVGNSSVESTKIVMDNVITVNGGFNK